MPTVSELGQAVKAKYPGVYDSIPDDYLGRMTKAKYPGSYDTFTESTEPRPVGKLAQTPSAGTRLKTRALGAAPAAGGLILGLAGTALGGVPGGLAGATIGGAGGKAIQQYGTGQELNANDIAREGAFQGLQEGAGMAMSAGSAALSRPVMKGAVRASDKLTRGFPTLTEDLLEKRLPVGGLRGKTGGNRAEALMGRSAANTETLLRGSQRKFSAANVAREAWDEATNRAHDSKLRDQLQILHDQFLEDHASGISPTRLKEIKGLRQASSKAQTNAAAAGERISPGAQKLFDRAIAKGAKRELETIPGVGASEAETRRLIGATRALEHAERRPPMRFNLFMPETYPLASAMAPQVESRAALFLNHPGWRALLRQSPRLFFALSGLSQEEVPDVTAQP